MAFITAAGIFASSIIPGTILLTKRLDSGLAHYLLAPDTGVSSQSAMHLAHAVAARADLVEELPDLDDVQSVVWLKTERMPNLVSRDTQSGTDPAAVSRALAISMRPGQWVAVALRKPTQKERRWQLTWLESQMNTSNPQYHSRRSDSLVATFYAGAETPDEAAQLLRETAAAMPGFDMATRHETTSRVRDSRGAPCYLELSWSTLRPGPGTSFAPPSASTPKTSTESTWLPIRTTRTVWNCRSLSGWKVQFSRATDVSSSDGHVILSAHGKPLIGIFRPYYPSSVRSLFIICNHRRCGDGMDASIGEDSAHLHSTRVNS